MRSIKLNQRLDVTRADKQSSLFLESTKDLLAWRDEGFPEGGLGTVGADDMRRVFRSQTNFEDGPEQLGNIVSFAADKMDLGEKERASLRKLIEPETEHIPVIPQGEKLPPIEVLSDVSRGKHDEEIRLSSEIKSLPDAYIFALYSIVQTLRDSREKISEVIGEFLVNYDVPESHVHYHEFPQYDAKGMEAVLPLGDFLRTVIREFDITRSSIRQSFVEASRARKESGKKYNKQALSNLISVLPDEEDNSEAQLPKDSARSPGTSAQPPVIESIPPQEAV